jgi:hypothetical protein
MVPIGKMEKNILAPDEVASVLDAVVAVVPPVVDVVADAADDWELVLVVAEVEVDDETIGCTT